MARARARARDALTNELDFQNSEEIDDYITGGWSDVQDFQNSVEIDDYARFAVDEYNKQQNRLINFRRVVAAQQQLVSGWNYRLSIECEDGNSVKLYEATVYVNLKNIKRLTEFKASGSAQEAATGS